MRKRIPLFGEYESQSFENVENNEFITHTQSHRLRENIANQE